MSKTPKDKFKRSASPDYSLSRRRVRRRIKQSLNAGDECPHEKPVMDFDRGYNHLFNYRYLERWILSRAGRKWSEVYSDFCNQFVSGYRGREALSYLKYVVCESAFMDEAGKIFMEDPAYGVVAYVHPISGILLKSKSKHERWKRSSYIDDAKNRGYRCVIDSNNLKIQHHKIDGVWYRVTLREANAKETEQETFDPIYSHKIFVRDWMIPKESICYSINKHRNLSPGQKQTLRLLDKLFSKMFGFWMDNSDKHTPNMKDVYRFSRYVFGGHFYPTEFHEITSKSEKQWLEKFENTSSFPRQF